MPATAGAWATYPALEDLFVYNGSGVMPGRTWVIAPDAASLEERWRILSRERDPKKKELLFHPHLRGGKPGDKHIRKTVAKALGTNPHRDIAVINDSGACIPPVRYGFRSFDRQWIIPDARLINQPNPTLWDAYSDRQVFLTALEAHSPSRGPAVTFSGLVPDLHHYKGSFGGRAYPLWRNAEATLPNIKPAFIVYLSQNYGAEVVTEDVMAYLAAVLAHPAFTSRFIGDLVRPGLRVPFTADANLFRRAAEIGREIVWLHTYGERFVDARSGRPPGPPRLSRDRAPRIPAAGAIPSAPAPLPDDIDYDPGARRLRIGKGYIDNVPPAVWEYEVSGKEVIKQWFSYRRRDRSRPIIGDRRPPSPLDKVQPVSWLAEYTTDLIDLLHVLGRLVLLQPRQRELLEEICSSRTLDEAMLREAGALESPDRKSDAAANRALKAQGQLDLS